MKSHAYARAVIQAAEYILSKPEFDMETTQPRLYIGWFWDKELFLAAVRALGEGKKEYSGTDLRYCVTHGAEITCTIPRDKVCRKVQEAKWECEALLSPEEEATLEEQ